MKNMTALMCAFIKLYHYKNNRYKIYNDKYVKNIILNDEYNMIYNNLISGIDYFDSNFIGNDEDKIKYIINNFLGSSVLGKSAFCELSLNNAIKFGCKQYLVYASGYDMSCYKVNNIKVFEIDKKEIIEDKKKRLINSNINDSKTNYITCDFTKENWIKEILTSSYDKNEISFNSLWGLSYYLTKEEFNLMIENISNIICSGSTIIFDYATIKYSKSSKLAKKLAHSSKEDMKSNYTYEEIENILYQNGLLIYEHLNNVEMTENYFLRYNILNPNSKIIANPSVNYCLAVKKNL